jgi:tartrate-resistant acid phosphatase type 5
MNALLSRVVVIVVGGFALTSCTSGGLTAPPPLDLSAPSQTDAMVTPPPPVRMRFAVIGDFGVDTPDESRVANLVKQTHPDFIITVGDNNYPSGEATTIDSNIGQYYSEFIGDYHGSRGKGSPINRFFPSLGNHDWYATNGSQPYLDYFTSLPGNRRYYDFVQGDVHFFAVDADDHEPDGNTADSVQAHWLHDAMAKSTSCFNIVYFHQPPFSSGPPQFIQQQMNWPFHAWGADLVLSGHQHQYERLEIDGIPYVVDGLGGALNRFMFPAQAPGSLVRYNDDFGALLVEVMDGELDFRFRNVRDEIIDAFTINKTCANSDGGTSGL